MSINEIALVDEALAQQLMEMHAPSRIAAHDGSLYDFSSEAAEFARHYMGWATLASRPPCSIASLQALADDIRDEGLDAVVLIGQGGSSQASMTVAQLATLAGDDIAFHTMDVLSPKTVRSILEASDPQRTIYIVSSKSGSTLEPTVLEAVVWNHVVELLGEEAAGRRFVALTDLHSALEKHAQDCDYRAVVSTPSDVGGRFSALTAFGLLPMALLGLSLQDLIERACVAERMCAADSLENPALRLAAFLAAGVRLGRDKLSLCMPFDARAFGLWTEQLVAESLGKDGKGIFPHVEFDTSALAQAHADRSAVVYSILGRGIGGIGDLETAACVGGVTEGAGIEGEAAKLVATYAEEGAETAACAGDADAAAGIESAARVAALVAAETGIPTLGLTIRTPADVVEHFVLWEYAVAMCGVLLNINPFNQPDVESSKIHTRKILAGKTAKTPEASTSWYPVETTSSMQGGEGIESACISARLARTSPHSPQTSFALDEALALLVSSIGDGDYFAINAFLPDEAELCVSLENLRRQVTDGLGVVSSLGIGPRYLHSTGQYHKGGPDTGVFLILATDEPDDIAVPGHTYPLSAVPLAQAKGDFGVLASRNRRALFIHLSEASAQALEYLDELFRRALKSVS